MREDSSTVSWGRVDADWCAVAQTNDFRNIFILPYTLSRLGAVADLDVLDLGCGEGGYARALASRGARVTAVDCAPFFVEYAAQAAGEAGLSIRHLLGNSAELSELADDSFDLVLCAMMLMDCENFLGTLREVKRVLRPGGRCFASVLHPCFNGRDIRWEDAGAGKRVVAEDYFLPATWEKPPANGVGASVVWRHRTMEDYVKGFVAAGLRIVDLDEPRPTETQMAASPRIAWLDKIPMFLFWTLEA